MSGADATATFAMHLESDVGATADASADSLAALRDEITGGVGELRNMQAALRNLKGSGAVAAESIKSLRDRIAANKAIVAQQQARYIELGGTFRNVARDAKQPAAGIRGILEALKGAPGPIGNLASKLGNVSSSSLLAHGRTVMLVGGFIAVGAAAAVAVAALAKYGFAAADARRSEGLLLEGLSKTKNYFMAAAGFSQVADSASFLQSTIDQVSDGVALGRDKITEFAGSLYRAGLRSGNLQAALEGMAIVASTQGEAAAESWKGWALGAGMVGQSVKGLAADVKTRLGGIAARQLLSLDVQSRKLRENFARLFSGVRIEGMLQGIGKITELFSQSTATGRGLATLTNTILNPLAATIEAIAPSARDFFRGMVLGALEVQLAVLKALLAFKQSPFGSTLISGIKSLSAALGSALPAFEQGRVLVWGVAAAMGAFAVVTFPVTAGIMAVVGAAAILSDAISGMDWEYLGKNWKKVGGAIIDGLIDGIVSGTTAVLAAVRDLGLSAWKAFKASIQSASPSKLFFKAAYTVPQGIEGGFKSGKPLVTRAVADLVDAPRAEFRKTQAAASSIAPSAASILPRRPSAAAIAGVRHAAPAASSIAADVRDAQTTRLPVGRDDAAGSAPAGRLSRAQSNSVNISSVNVNITAPEGATQDWFTSYEFQRAFKQRLNAELEAIAIQIAAMPIDKI